MKTVAIIGGGAAGLYAACRLADSGMRVLVLEKQNRVGRKLLSTGNGRCNLTNLNAAPANYHGGGRHLQNALKALPPQAAVDFFESLGVVCAPDEEGRVYPLSNQAAGVLDALRLYAEEHGCETRCEFEVQKVARKGEGFNIVSANGEAVRADFALVACGGLAAPKLGGGAGGYKILESFGHEIAPRVPGLAALRTDPDAVRALKGVRAQVEMELFANGKPMRREAGEVLFGDGGVSGIAAMQLARDVNQTIRKNGKCQLKLNFLPGAPEGLIVRRAQQLPLRSMEDFLSGIVPKRLGQVLAKAAGVMSLSLTARELTPAQCSAIQSFLTDWVLPIRGTLDFDQAQITCGGASLVQFNPATLESLRAPNLFAAGEVLDVDGDCGGFNLQWAWASAELACREIERRR